MAAPVANGTTPAAATPAATTVRTEPILEPVPNYKPATPAPLTAEQEAKYASILSTVETWETIPTTTAKNAPQAALTDAERMWLSRDNLLRYLRATKWNVANALKRLQATLSWRREYGADGFTADYISVENETGKQVHLGYDVTGRPCLYLNPGLQNTKMSDRQIHSFCYMLDRVIDMMPPGVENSALIINFKDAASGSIPSVGQARAALNMLQNHNPERLGKALISETPWYVNTFFKLITPFIDPVTRDKMKFNEDLKQYVPPAQLWDAYGGDLKFKYDHAVYWPAWTGECQRRREAYRERWEKAGKRIGEYEFYLKGGDHPSLQDEEKAKAAAAAAPAEEVNTAEVKVADAANGETPAAPEAELANLSVKE